MVTTSELHRWKVMSAILIVVGYGIMESGSDLAINSNSLRDSLRVDHVAPGHQTNDTSTRHQTNYNHSVATETKQNSSLHTEISDAALKVNNSEVGKEAHHTNATITHTNNNGHDRNHSQTKTNPIKNEIEKPPDAASNRTGTLDARTGNRNSNHSSQTTLNDELSCFRPDTSRVLSYLRLNQTLPKPALNVGMPKIGSTALQNFFMCSNWKASHWYTQRQGHIGQCMRKAKKHGQELLKTCDSWYYKRFYHEQFPNKEQDHGTQAFMQMDHSNTVGECVFPQIQYLEEFHQEAPNATFILLFRPIDDWARSVVSWSPRGMGSMAGRLTKCDLPGLPVGKGNTTDDMMDWWCWHVNHIRSFVDKYPSHKLVELDLYDTDYTAPTLAKLFGSEERCWGKANANKKNQGKTRRML